MDKIVAIMTERMVRTTESRRLFWGRDIALVVIGGGLAAAPGAVAEFRVTTGVPIAVIGIMGIIRGIRELRKSRS